MAQQITFEKIVPEGKALAYWHDKALFVVGPLPGEVALVRVTREKRSWAEGVVREWVRMSPRRGEAREVHFGSCSPWQGVDYDYQLELKRMMLAESLRRPDWQLEVADFVGAERQFGYRNKLEFSFVKGESGRLELGFHERGSLLDLVPTPDGCVLGSEAMNGAAVAVLERINELELVDVAVSLVVRQSQTHGPVIAVLQVKEPVAREWARLMVPEVAGVAVVRRVKHDVWETLWSDGELELAETVGGVELQYPWDSFFQVNVPMFERALEVIVAQVVPDTKVVDLYGGAGTIGLAVARVAREVVGVEIVTSSVRLAQANAARNNLGNYSALDVASEKMESALLDGADTVIVDPPRAGLHPAVVKMLLAARPRQIVYLSCNPVTQARDVRLLLEGYEASAVTGFDFYPGTLHMESLVVLTRR